MAIKNIHISFLGNGLFDSRIVNLYDSLVKEGCNVKVTSFTWENEQFKNSNPDIKIIKLNKNHSFIFYFSFYFYLTRELLKSKAELYIAEDIYSLPVTYFFAKYRKSKIYYNSREIYAFLAGLRNKKFVQKIISSLEMVFIKKVDLVLTTGEMDSEFLEKTYSLKKTLVIRNIPKFIETTKKINIRKIYNIDDNYKIILYQGVLLEGRGVDIIIDCLQEIDNVFFLVIGDGPFREKFEKQTQSLKVQNRVCFTGKIPHQELINYTVECDLGLALIENLSISYYYALPNKLFEYINAGIPVISSNLPQMKQIVEDYQVGIVVNPENRNELIFKLKELLNSPDRISNYKLNCIRASKDLNWDAEFDSIKSRLLNE